MTTGESRSPGWKPRIVTIAVVVFLLGVPAAVLAPILNGKAVDQAYSGSQPGGRLCGSVCTLGDESALGGVLIAVSLAHFDGQGDGSRDPRIDPPLETEWRKIRTDAAGEFELELPPHEGFYIVRAGGEAYASSVRWFSFLDRARKVRATVPPLRFALAQGGRLSVRISSADAASRPRGHLELKRPPTFFGFGGSETVFETDFEGARIDTGVLPVQSLQLVVYLETGQTFSQWVNLTAGLNEVEIDLDRSEAALSPDGESPPSPSPAPEDRSPSPSSSGR